MGSISLLTTSTSISEGNLGRLVANDNTSWRRFTTCPLYPYWPCGSRRWTWLAWWL